MFAAAVLEETLPFPESNKTKHEANEEIKRNKKSTASVNEINRTERERVKLGDCQLVHVRIIMETRA